MLHSLQGFDFVVVVCVVSTKSLFTAAGFIAWWCVDVRVLFENSIVCQCTFVCGLVACLVVLAVPDVFGCGWCVPVVLPLNL